ncbi:MAG: hypothetical protein ABI565_06135 [Vicinamibacteria bacterium]
MNKLQRIVLSLGVIAILALGLFPPWIEVQQAGTASRELQSDFRFLFSPQARRYLTTGTSQVVISFRIDYQRCLLLLGIVTAATLGGFFVLKDGGK